MGVRGAILKTCKFHPEHLKETISRDNLAREIVYEAGLDASSKGANCFGF